MSKYQLIIKVPIEAIDNLEARSIYLGTYKNIIDSIPEKNASVKLQRIFDNKEPEGVVL
jgi:hypothetical protein